MAGALLPALSFDGDSVNAAVGAASAETALPLNADGVIRARFYLLSADTDCYIRLGLTGLTVATGTGTFLKATDGPLIVNANGTHIATIQDAVSGFVNITPLADQ